MFLNTFKILEKIDYPKESYSSEVLLENGDSKILLFAMNKESELPEHFSPVNAAILVLKGKLCFKTANNHYPIEEDEMFFVPANEKHSVVAKEKSKFIVIRI